MAGIIGIRRAVSCPVLIYGFSLLCAVRLVVGQLHCYCNSPRCASNYMCESQLGCYSYLVETDGQSNSPYLHGCIEAITVARCEESATGSNGTDTATSAAAAAPPPPTTTDAINSAGDERARQRQRQQQAMLELSCCYESMCNFEDGSMVRHDAHGGTKDDLDDQYNQPYEAASDQALWFRAAVIAVPIAGVCILIGLITIAARMLRSEEKHFATLDVPQDAGAAASARTRQGALFHANQTTHAARAPRVNPTSSTGHLKQQQHESSVAVAFLDNSRVKNVNITGNKLADLRQEKSLPSHHHHHLPHHHHHHHHDEQSKMNNICNVAKVTNQLMRHQRCVNECPRLLPVTSQCGSEKMYRENFDVV